MNFIGLQKINSIVLCVLALAACDTLTGSDGTNNTGSDNPAVGDGLWTWVSGSSTANGPGIYGTQGVANTANVPGARFGAATWIDENDDLWLFGGFGRASGGSQGELNDLWRFDGAGWVWVSGSFQPNNQGAYGNQGVGAPENLPPARSGAAEWIDHQIAGIGQEADEVLRQLRREASGMDGNVLCAALILVASIGFRVCDGEQVGWD